MYKLRNGTTVLHGTTAITRCIWNYKFAEIIVGTLWKIRTIQDCHRIAIRCYQISCKWIKWNKFTLFIVLTEECIEGPSSWYRGSRSHSAKGTTCQRWDTDKPHKPKHVPKDGGHHNHCRYNITCIYFMYGVTADNAPTDKLTKFKRKAEIINLQVFFLHFHRNPDNDLRGTWCYTINNNTRWEYCNISKCRKLKI